MKIFDELRDAAAKRFNCLNVDGEHAPSANCKNCSFCFVNSINVAETKLKAAIKKKRERGMNLSLFKTNSDGYRQALDEILEML
jgi:hypothetical protein